MAEAAREWNADIKDMGEKIVNLSLLQAKELSDYLKDEHGLEAAAGGAVVMAGPGGGAAEEVAEPTPKECASVPCPMQQHFKPGILAVRAAGLSSRCIVT